MGHQHFDSLDLLQTRSAQVRALALCLVRDAATADDLVQDALTKALRRPASVTGDWRAWIGVTLRNLVRDSAREASRREGRERRAAEAARDATALNSDAESTVERAEAAPLESDPLDHGASLTLPDAGLISTDEFANHRERTLGQL